MRMLSKNMLSYAVDIGMKLNAKNYVGWDCEVVREFSVGIPKMLMQ